MRYGIEVVLFGEYANPGPVVDLAVAAEAAGWEAISLWDHAHFWGGAGDPWVTLAAVAMRTERLRLVTGVSPVPRYRPVHVARALHALDALSGGRVTFGAGLGVAVELRAIGEDADARTRAAMTDEALPLIRRWCDGETVSHEGDHYRVREVQVCDVQVRDAVQRPLPIWIGGSSPSALRRAARWDGWTVGTIDETSRIVVPPEQVADGVRTIAELSEAHRDVAVSGASDPGSTLPAEYRQAGATWWFESLFGLRGSHRDMLARIAAGPPSTTPPR